MTANDPTVCPILAEFVDELRHITTWETQADRSHYLAQVDQIVRHTGVPINGARPIDPVLGRAVDLAQTRHLALEAKRAFQYVANTCEETDRLFTGALDLTNLVAMQEGDKFGAGCRIAARMVGKAVVTAADYCVRSNMPHLHQTGLIGTIIALRGAAAYKTFMVG